MTYQQLAERDFKVTATEAAGIRHTTDRAMAALNTLQAVVDADPYAEDIKTLNATLQAIRARIIPFALLTIVAEEPYEVTL